MGELERIADQLRRALDGDTWSGRSLGSIVGAVPAGRAAERPANGGNTAWQLLAHIGCWLDVARIRFEGAAHDPAPGDHMPAPVDDLTEAAVTPT